MSEKVGITRRTLCHVQGIGNVRVERKLLRKSRHRKLTNNAWITVLSLLLAAPSTVTYGEISWQWSARQRPSGAIVGQDSGTLTTSAGSPSIVLDEPTGFVAAVGPLSTSMEFAVNGQVDPARRSIGTGVEIIAE